MKQAGNISSTCQLPIATQLVYSLSLLKIETDPVYNNLHSREYKKYTNWIPNLLMLRFKVDETFQKLTPTIAHNF